MLQLPLDGVYGRRRLRDIRELIVRIVDLALANKPILKINGPAGIIANVTTDGSKKYVHLLNYCGTMHENGNPIDEIIPVRDLKVMLLCNNEYRTIEIKELKLFKSLQLD